MEWMTKSGIQNEAGEHAGGFNGWYDIDRKTYPFVYSEITGYGITTLLFMNSLKVARRPEDARWIMNRAMLKVARRPEDAIQIGARTRAYNTEPDDMYSFESNMLLIFD